MNKTAWRLLAAVCLLGGCTAPAVLPKTAAESAPPAAGTVLPVPPKTAAPVPPPKTPEKAVPAADSAEPSKPASAPAPKTPQTAPKTTPKETVQSPPPTAPVLPADRPVFEDETLIETNERLLNPYAYLAADAAKRPGAPWDGEQLKYGIYYAFVKAGNAYIRNRGVVNIDGRPAYLIQTTAFSASVIDAFFKVRDINQSWIDAETFYSRGYGQSVREGSYKRDEWVQFSPAEGRYYGRIQKKEAPREINGKLATEVADFLSALYYVRAQKLEIGQDIVFDIVNREKQYPLVVKVLRKESIKTPAGTFDCIVVEPQLRGEGIFVAKGKSLTVWLTDDPYRMPVKMKTEVFIGSVSAALLDYKRL